MIEKRFAQQNKEVSMNYRPSMSHAHAHAHLSESSDKRHVDASLFSHSSRPSESITPIRNCFQVSNHEARQW